MASPNIYGRQFLQMKNDFIAEFNFYCPVRQFCGVSRRIRFSEVVWTTQGDQNQLIDYVRKGTSPMLQLIKK